VWLCIDQGGHSTRAAIFDRSGAIVALASAAIETVRREPHYVEHDAAALIDSVDHCIVQAAAAVGSRVAEIEAAGIATQRSTLVCASRRSGRALTPLISWQDRRGLADIEQFHSHAERISDITGLRLSPHYGLAKLRWCLQHMPAVRQSGDAGDLVGAPLASFVIHHLCGADAWCIDPVNASRTLLMDARSLSWSAELLQLFDLPRGFLPDIQPCRSQWGGVGVGGYSVPLRVATGDQAAALFCVGEPRSGTAFVNVGTGAFIQAVAGSTLIADPALLGSVAWQDPDRRLYVLEGTVNGAASAIDAVSTEIGCRLDPEGPELAAALADIAHAPLFLNGVSGLGSPDWVADFASRFVGDGEPVLRLAAVYESIVFLIVRNLDHMRRRLPVAEITLTGGLAQSDWIAQTLANVSGMPVARLAESEATLVGLAYLVSDGQIHGSEASMRFEPSSAAVAVDRYREWTAAMDAAVRAPAVGS
jgi:glycerol kinase